MLNNLIYSADAYKWGHEKFYPDGTEKVFSYLESRGGKYDYSVFFGLQYILKKWLSKPLTQEMLDEAKESAKNTFFDDPNVFNADSWQLLIDRHGGKLPLEICAVPEGTKVPVGNVLMTIVNTDPDFFWLTNALETLLQNVWYTITVATRSNFIMGLLKEYFEETSDNVDLYKFYCHDFGQRGVSCMEQAGLGGLAHLVNGLGSDTMMAIPFGVKYYNAKRGDLLFSVKATEHSIQTALGENDEFKVTKDICENHPDGILSVVSDSYNITRAVEVYCGELKETILKRNGKFVVRPDSPRFIDDTPEDQILWIVYNLWESFGGSINSKGYKVLDPHVGVIYGDSLTEEDIDRSLNKLQIHGFSADNCVYGCGGYLLQKVNRDTQKFAIKCSAQKRNGEWFDVVKTPLDKTKKSKAGRLKLVKDFALDGSWAWKTINQSHPLYFDYPNELKTVFKDGEIVKTYDFSEVRERAAK